MMELDKVIWALMEGHDNEASFLVRFREFS